MVSYVLTTKPFTCTLHSLPWRQNTSNFPSTSAAGKQTNLTTYHHGYGNEVRHQKVIHWAKQRKSQRTHSMDQFEHFEIWNYRLLIKRERKDFFFFHSVKNFNHIVMFILIYQSDKGWIENFKKIISQIKGEYKISKKYISLVKVNNFIKKKIQNWVMV